MRSGFCLRLCWLRRGWRQRSGAVHDPQPLPRELIPHRAMTCDQFAPVRLVRPVAVRHHQTQNKFLAFSVSVSLVSRVAFTQYFIESSPVRSRSRFAPPSHVSTMRCNIFYLPIRLPLIPKLCLFRTSSFLFSFRCFMFVCFACRGCGRPFVFLSLFCCSLARCDLVFSRWYVNPPSVPHCRSFILSFV